MAVEQCELLNATELYTQKLVKLVNCMLCIFYHTKKTKNIQLGSYELVTVLGTMNSKNKVDKVKGFRLLENIIQQRSRGNRSIVGKHLINGYSITVVLSPM